MAKTPKERMAAMIARRKALGLKEWKLWVTDKEKAVVKPIVDEKLKDLRKKDSKK